MQNYLQILYIYFIGKLCYFIANYLSPCNVLIQLFQNKQYILPTHTRLVSRQFSIAFCCILENMSENTIFQLHSIWCCPKVHVIPCLKLLPKGQVQNGVRQYTAVVGQESLIQTSHSFVAYGLREAVENIPIVQTTTPFVDTLIE